MSIQSVYLAFWLDLRYIGAVLGTKNGDKGVGNVPPGVLFEGALVGSFVGIFVGALVGRLLGGRVGAIGGATYRYISNCAFIRST